MTGHTVGAHPAEVGQLGCAALVDAMGRLHGHRAHLLPLVSPPGSLAAVTDEAHRIEAEDADAASQIRGEDPSDDVGGTT